MIRAVGVVVPAHNEQTTLPGCLDAIDLALSEMGAGVSAHVVVVLDDCSDESAAIVAQHPRVTGLAVGVRSVGAARRAGVEQVLARTGAMALSDIWLATTDADTEVPRDWLVKQLAFAADGYEMVVGTIDVADWSTQPDAVARRWRQDYKPADGHGHIHGANMGCTAAAYVDAGGWPALGQGEDVALVAALSHRHVLRTAQLPVITSSRSVARAAGGFGDYLRELAG